MFTSPSDRVVFFHIPKCAGTSVYRSLAHTLPNRTALDKLFYRHRLTIINDVWHQKRRSQKLRRARRSRFVTGHFEWTTYENINPKSTDFLCTFIRDPKDRILSLYRYLSDPQGSKWLKERNIPDTNIQDLFLSGHMQLNWQIDNVMVRTFAGKYNEDLNGPTEWEAALSIAKTNLAKLDFIGRNDCFHEDLKQLSEKLNLPLNKDTTEENRSVITKDNFELSNEFEDILLSKYNYDDLLYKYALEHLIPKSI